MASKKTGKRAAGGRKKTIQEKVDQAARRMVAEKKGAAKSGKKTKGSSKSAATKPKRRVAAKPAATPPKKGRRKVRVYVPKNAQVVLEPKPGETLVIRGHAGRSNCKLCTADHDTSQHWSHAWGPEQKKDYKKRRSLLQRMKDVAAMKRGASRKAGKGAKKRAR